MIELRIVTTEIAKLLRGPRLIVLVAMAACLLGQDISVRHKVQAPCTPFSGYSHCRLLTVDHTQVGGSTLTNFPVLVSTTLGSGKLQNASCFDLVFTSNSGGTTKIPWEQETCVSGTGVIVDWVLCASCSSSVNTLLYVSYGNAGISTAQNTGANGPTNVWAGYLGVFHFANGTTLTATDSTSNARNGTLINAPTAAAGQIDGAAQFAAASSQYLTIPTSLDPTGTKTCSFWVYQATSATQQILSLNGTGTSDGFGVFLTGSTLSAVATSSTASGKDSSAGLSSTGVWYYVVVQKTSVQINKVFLNGTDVSTTASDYVLTSVAINTVGINQNGAAFPLNGRVDELRLAAGTLTQGWITAEYNNQKPSSTFLTVGGEI